MGKKLAKLNRIIKKKKFVRKDEEGVKNMKENEMT